MMNDEVNWKLLLVVQCVADILSMIYTAIISNDVLFCCVIILNISEAINKLMKIQWNKWK